MTTDLFERFHGAELRLEKVVCLGLQPYLALSSDTEEMLDDTERLLKETGLDIVIDEQDCEDPDVDEAAGVLMDRGFDKFFVLIAHAKRGGLYSTRWFYADSIEKAAEAAIAYEWPKERAAS